MCIKGRRTQLELSVVLAIALRRLVGRLATNHRDVVVEAPVPNTIIILQQHPTLRERPRKVTRVRTAAKRSLVGLVFQHDQEYMLYFLFSRLYGGRQARKHNRQRQQGAQKKTLHGLLSDRCGCAILNHRAFDCPASSGKRRNSQHPAERSSCAGHYLTGLLGVRAQNSRADESGDAPGTQSRARDTLYVYPGAAAGPAAPF